MNNLDEQIKMFELSDFMNEMEKKAYDFYTDKVAMYLSDMNPPRSLPDDEEGLQQRFYYLWGEFLSLYIDNPKKGEEYFEEDAEECAYTIADEQKENENE